MRAAKRSRAKSRAVVWSTRCSGTAVATLWILGMA